MPNLGLGMPKPSLLCEISGHLCRGSPAQAGMRPDMIVVVPPGGVNADEKLPEHAPMTRTAFH